MKKTLIALFALGSMAMATEELPSAVWSVEDQAVSGHTTIALTLEGGQTLNTTDGVTAFITVNWTGVSNAPMLWLCTSAGTGYANSAATFGYKGNGNEHHATLFSVGGGNGGTTNPYNNVASEVKTPDYIAATVGNAAKNASLSEKTLTFFMTTAGGTSNLYELMDSGDIQLLCTQTGMKTGDIDNLYIGGWNNTDSAQSGTASIALYNSVLTTEQMKALAPEPTTATLSLLALAGLCARRRRH